MYRAGKITERRGRDWEPVDYLQESFAPSGPETPSKSLKKVFRGLRPGTPPPESLEKVSKKYFGTFSGLVPDFFETFSRLFPAAVGLRPWDIFFFLGGGFGPGGPERLLQMVNGFLR